jgi:hypothetical protein
MSVNTTTTLVITSSWNQVATDDNNSANTVADVGQLSYQKIYTSGSTTGSVNQIFNQVGTLSSGGSGNFNLTGLQQSILGATVTKTFTGINSLTIQNRSTRPGFDININVSSSSGFREPFGHTTGVIRLSPNSCIHVNTAGREWAVNANSRQILLTDAGSGAAYSIALFGH